MGSIGWGTREMCPPLFQIGGYNMSCPPTFSLRISVWRGIKTECDVCHVLCEEFFILDVTHSNVDVETVWYGITDSDTFMNFYFENDFSILQVSRDRKTLLTASVRHLCSVVYCKKSHCLDQWSLTAAHVRDHCTAVICFVQTLANLLYCNTGCHVCRNRHRKI